MKNVRAGLRRAEVTRHSIRTLLMALVVDAALPMSGFAQSGEQSQSVVERASVPHTLIQTREIAAEQGLGFALGDTVGVAYFTLQSSGFRVVATVKSAESAAVRFVTTLAPDQIVTLSVPGKIGEASSEVSFVRQGERLVVKIPSRASN